MRIIIDTKLARVIVPDTFYKQIDAKNEVLKEGGVEKERMIDYTKFVEDAIATALKNPFIRKSDVKTLDR